MPGSYGKGLDRELQTDRKKETRELNGMWNETGRLTNSQTDTRSDKLNTLENSRIVDRQTDTKGQTSQKKTCG